MGGFTKATSGIATGGRSLWAGYPPIMVGYPAGGVYYGMDVRQTEYRTTPISFFNGRAPMGGVSVELYIYR